MVKQKLLKGALLYHLTIPISFWCGALVVRGVPIQFPTVMTSELLSEPRSRCYIMEIVSQEFDKNY